MHCLRLARAFTGRSKLLKFEGNFHGYHDQVMYAIGTPADRLGPEDAPALYPGSSGLPAGLDDNLVVVPYNRPDLLEAAFARHGTELAAVICEPIYYNAGCIVPTPEFLNALRRLTQTWRAADLRRGAERVPHGTGRSAGIPRHHSRLVYAGQGGRRRLSAERVRRPQGHHGSPHAARRLPAQRHLQRPCDSRRRGLAAVTAYRQPGFYDHIHAVAERLYSGLNEVFARHAVVARVQGLGARFGIYFGVTEPIRSYRDAVRHQREQMLRFIAAAVRHGVYFHDYGGAACHHGFCAAMTLADTEDVLNRLTDAVRELRE